MDPMGFVGWKTPTEIKMAWNLGDGKENDDMGGLAWPGAVPFQKGLDPRIRMDKI